MKLKVFLVSVAFVFLSFNSLAQIPDDIDIEGDEIFYSNNNQILHVSGNVKLNYYTYEVTADLFEYDLQNKQLYFPKQFTFKQNDQRITGSNFIFDGKKNKGRADFIEAHLYDVYIKGDKLKILPEKFVLEQTLCTTCGDASKFSVRSKKIEMYYILGILTAKKSVISLGFLPFNLYMPYFIYSNSKMGLIEESNMFPVLGSSKVEGAYLKQRVNYIVNPQLAGSVNLAITEKLGTFLGNQSRYVVNDKVLVNLNYYYNLKDQDSRGNMLLSYSFFSKDMPNTGLFSGLEKSLAIGLDRRLSFDFFYQYKMVVNDMFVNYRPMLRLKMNKVKVSDYLTMDLDFNGARVEEFKPTSLLSLNRVQFKTTASYLRPLSDTWSAYTTTFLDFIYYEADSSWRRGFQSIGLAYEGIANLRVGYNRKLFNDGESLFEHETNYAVVSDEVELFFSKQVQSFNFQSHLYYSLESESLRDFIVSVDLLDECWKIGLGWQKANEQFLFRFELL